MNTIFTLISILIWVATMVTAFVSGYQLGKRIQLLDDSNNKTEEEDKTMDLTMQAILATTLTAIDKEKLLKETSDKINEVVPEAIAYRISKEFEKEFSETSTLKLREISTNFFDGK